MNFSQNSNETLNPSDVQKFVKWIFHDFDILFNIAVIIVDESTLTKKTLILCSFLQLHVHVILGRDK